MSKHIHEIRDPIHNFVRLDSDERKVLDSRPFQRLRHIHQLALTYLIYPAATHKRFEHSLGVMELAGRVFDVVTNPVQISDAIKRSVPEITQQNQLQYWRRVLRMAALCHDMGHLPFSHAAEKELLPQGWDHERLTQEIVRSSDLTEIWEKMTPPLRGEDVEKLAVGPRKAKSGPDRTLEFSTWETLLSEIIVGDAFGVDRMDYLLRDSYHIGVVYGRFDHFRLIDTLRLLPSSPEEHGEPALGIEEGGLQSAEALLMGRYHMYSQVYFHPIRRIYDIHLKDFLSATLPEGKFTTEIDSHLQQTDNNITAQILKAVRSESEPGYDAARRIANHDHFKVLYQRNPDDIRMNPEAGRVVFEAAKSKFGDDNVRRDSYTQKREATLFPVLLRDGRIGSAELLSEVLQHLPVVDIDYVFIHPNLHSEALEWLAQHRTKLIQPTGGQL